MMLNFCSELNLLNWKYWFNQVIELEEQELQLLIENLATQNSTHNFYNGQK